MSECIAFSIFIFVSILLFAGISFFMIVDKSQDENISSHQNVEVRDYADTDKVKVSVYYQTMSYYCQKWMINHLCPVVEKLSEYFYVDFVPYAKTEYHQYDTLTEISCHHGREECERNRIQSCALKTLPYLQSTKLICCMELENEFEPQGKTCAEKLGIDISSIIHCANGINGLYYYYLNSIKTIDLHPHHQGFPWIIFNDEFQDDEEIKTARNDFISVLCKYIRAPKPAECSVDRWRRITR